MSHVVHPYSFRIGVLRDWKSRWFGAKNYKEFLRADVLLRSWLTERVRGMYVAEIEMERSQNDLNIILKTSRPGLLIGRGGEGIEKMKNEIRQYAKKREFPIPKNFKISVEEVRLPDTHAKILAQSVAEELEKRLPFRRIMKQALEKAMSNKEVKGVKVALAGRLGGAEMARHEWLKRGQVPLTTLRADIDFARLEARLPYGRIGIKVWIYKGEVFNHEAQNMKHGA